MNIELVLSRLIQLLELFPIAARFLLRLSKGESVFFQYLPASLLAQILISLLRYCTDRWSRSCWKDVWRALLFKYYPLRRNRRFYYWAGRLERLIEPEKHAPKGSSIAYPWFYSCRAAPRYSLTNLWSNQRCYTERIFRGMKFRPYRRHPHSSIRNRRNGSAPTPYPSFPSLSYPRSP